MYSCSESESEEFVVVGEEDALLAPEADHLDDSARVAPEDALKSHDEGEDGKGGDLGYGAKLGADGETDADAVIERAGEKLGLKDDIETTEKTDNEEVDDVVVETDDEDDDEEDGALDEGEERVSNSLELRDCTDLTHPSFFHAPKADSEALPPCSDWFGTFFGAKVSMTLGQLLILLLGNAVLSMFSYGLVIQYSFTQGYKMPEAFVLDVQDRRVGYHHATAAAGVAGPAGLLSRVSAEDEADRRAQDDHGALMGCKCICRPLLNGSTATSGNETAHGKELDASNHSVYYLEGRLSHGLGEDFPQIFEAHEVEEVSTRSVERSAGARGASGARERTRHQIDRAKMCMVDGIMHDQEAETSPLRKPFPLKPSQAPAPYSTLFSAEDDAADDATSSYAPWLELPETRSKGDRERGKEYLRDLHTGSRNTRNESQQQTELITLSTNLLNMEYNARDQSALREQVRRLERRLSDCEEESDFWFERYLDSQKWSKKGAQCRYTRVNA